MAIRHTSASRPGAYGSAVGSAVGRALHGAGASGRRRNRERHHALRDQGVAILVVEQKIADVPDVSDHVYVLAEGRLVFDTAADQVQREGGISKIYFGDDEPAYSET
jgi:ABC-type multidrug transport system ATPase subunit